MAAPLLALHPEILAQIASYLPLGDVAALIRTHPDLRSLQDSTTCLHSFAPWRRRHDRLLQAYEKSLREIENRVFAQEMAQTSQSGSEVTSSIIRGTQVTISPMEREYERVMIWLFDAYRLLPAQQGEQGIGATMGSRMFPKLTERCLFIALDKVLLCTDSSRKFLVLPYLHIELSTLVCKLETYLPLKVMERVSSTTFVVTASSSGMMETSAAAYKVIAAYLLHTALKPDDVLQILDHCVPGNIQARDDACGDHEAALTEFYCFLATFFELWDQQQDMLREPSENDQHRPIPVVFSVQARRMLKGRLRGWIRNRFRVPKPLILLDRPIIKPNIPGRSNTLSKRTVSSNLPSTYPIAPQRAGLKRSASWQHSCSMPSLAESSPSVEPSLSLTEEQQNIVGTDVGVGDLIKVRAYAGTGKTRTLVEYAKARPDKKMLYIAFNKSAQLDARQKFSRNVDCKTFHSLCYEVLRSGLAAPYVSHAFFHKKSMEIPSFGFGNKQIIELLKLEKSETIREALINPQSHGRPGARKIEDNQKRFPTATSTATAIRIAFDRFCQSTATEVRESCLPSKMVDVLGLDRAAVLRWVRRIWKGMSEGTDRYISHDAYAKLIHLAGCGYDDGQRSEGDEIAFGEYHLIMFDEAQDANPCMASMILRQKFFTAIMIVGDPYQKIYGFRGAGNDCFDDVKYPPSHTFYLTHSFRFGDAIAGVANVLLRALREEVGVSGVRKEDRVHLALGLEEEFGTWDRKPSAKLKVLTPSESGKYTVIFRKNISLIEYAITYAFTHPDHKMALRTSVPKKSLFMTLRSAHALINGSAAKSGPLRGFNTWGDLKDHVEAERNEYGTSNESQILSLVVALEGKLEDPSFLDRIAICEKMTIDGTGLEGADITLITAHQAKGLEWDRVVVYNDFAPDHALRGRLGRVKYYQEECNMMYVAVTRARKELIISRPVDQWLAAEFGKHRVFLAASPPAPCMFDHELFDEDGQPVDEATLSARKIALYYENYMHWGSFAVKEVSSTGIEVPTKQSILLCCLGCAAPMIQATQRHYGEMISTVRALCEKMGLNDDSGVSHPATESTVPAMRERKTWDEGYGDGMKEETNRIILWAAEQELEVDLETMIML